MSLPCKKLQRKEMSISLLLENKEKSKSPRLKTKKSRQNFFKENLERRFDLGKRRHGIQVWLQRRETDNFWFKPELCFLDLRPIFGIFRLPDMFEIIILFYNQKSDALRNNFW